MKFVKVIIDGKEYFKMVDESGDVDGTVDGDDVEIVDADIEDTKDTEKKRGSDEFFAKVKSGAEEFGTKIADGARDLGAKIATGAKDFGVWVASGTKKIGESLFGKTFDSESREARLLRLLPFMSEEETHKLCEQFLADDETLSKLSLTAIMPFLSTEDCDALFLKCLDANLDKDIVECAAFVSKECLSGVVDGYIAGKYPDLDIDELYPFLADEDIKRIFYHILNSEE